MVTTHEDILDGDFATDGVVISNPRADGFLSLREAVAAANINPTKDTISFDPILLTGATITLTKAEGQLEITESVTIDGMDTEVTIKGEDTDPSNPNDGTGIRLFNITDASNGSDPPDITLERLTLTGADPSPR